MQRKLFFFLERLQMTRSERITVTVLLVLVTIFGTLNLVFEQKAVYNKEHYDELERIFGERSRQIQSERNQILARYNPQDYRNESLPSHSQQINPEKAKKDTVDTHDGAEEEPASNKHMENKVNINTASAGELQQLPGIGPAYASRIIQWREKNGNFTSTDQLIEIRGIGPKRLETLKPLVTVKESN